MIKKIVIFFSFFLSFNAFAEDMNIYVADVDINATAEDAAQAKEKALKEANRQALYAVINRISTADTTSMLDNLNDNQILNFIREVSVVSEKTVEARYIASLKITINAPVLKAYLTEKNAPISILPETNIIIIPVYKEAKAAKALLWEENNIWYNTWLDNTVDSGQITFHPIAKTENNQNILQAEDAIQLNGLSLDSVRRNSGINEIYIAEAVQTAEKLEIILKSANAGQIFSKFYPAETPRVLETAIKDIKAEILKRLQQQAKEIESAYNQLTIVFSYKTLKEWADLQKQLKEINVITKTNIDAFANHRVQISIEYTGTLEALKDKMALQNLNLFDAGNFYVIERLP